MKTDADLRKDVEAELAWAPPICSPSIDVTVKEGVVTLTGRVGTYAEKLAAEKAVRRVAGAKAIALELDVRLSPEHRRSDTDIAAAAGQSLNGNSLVLDTVTATVDEGRIILHGEVDWDYQRRGAEKAVRNLTGVVGISNEFTIKTPAPTPSDLRTRITQALKSTG